MPMLGVTLTDGVAVLVCCAVNVGVASGAPVVDALAVDMEVGDVVGVVLALVAAVGVDDPTVVGATVVLTTGVGVDPASATEPSTTRMFIVVPLASTV